MRRTMSWIVMGAAAIGAIGLAMLATARAGNIPARPAMRDFDGRKESGDAARRRPWDDPRDHRGTCIVENLRAHDITDRNAIYLTATSRDKPRVNGELRTFSSMVIRNCDVGPMISRQANADGSAKHLNAILVEGSTEPAVAPTLLIEDVAVHDLTDSRNGGIMSILIHGPLAQVTLRRVSISRVQHNVIIGELGGGDVLIEDCPNIRVAICGRPGDIGAVRVRRCPGAVIANTTSHGVNPNAKIIFEDAPAPPATKPAPPATNPAPTTTPSPTTIPATVPTTSPTLMDIDAKLTEILRILHRLESTP